MGPPGEKGNKGDTGIYNFFLNYYDVENREKHLRLSKILAH